MNNKLFKIAEKNPVTLFSYRVFKFFKNYFFRNPLYVFTYAFGYLWDDFKFDVKFYSHQDLIQKILSGKSLLRLGDADIHILNGQNTGGEKYDKNLAKKLFWVIKNYTEESSYVLSINEHMINLPNSFLRSEGSLPLWLPSKTYFKLYFNKNIKYADASLFYYKHSFRNILHEYLQDKRVILVSNRDNIERFKVNSKGHIPQIEYVEVPWYNAFTIFEEIKEKVNKLIKNNDTKKTVILAVMGGTAKALVHDMAKYVQVLDIGRGIDLAYTDNDLEFMLQHNSFQDKNI